MGDNVNTILRAQLPFGNSKSKYKIFYSGSKENIIYQINGHGAKKISEKETMKEHIIKYVWKNLMNFLFLTNIKNSFIYLIHGSFNIKILFSTIRVKNNWI